MMINHLCTFRSNFCAAQGGGGRAGRQGKHRANPRPTANPAVKPTAACIITVMDDPRDSSPPTAIVQQYSKQQYSNTAIQRYSNTAIQQYSNTAIQQSHAHHATASPSSRSRLTTWKLLPLTTTRQQCQQSLRGSRCLVPAHACSLSAGFFIIMSSSPHVLLVDFECKVEIGGDDSLLTGERLHGNTGRWVLLPLTVHAY